MTEKFNKLTEELFIGVVWPVSVADAHAGVLTPKETEKLYEASSKCREAVDAINELQAEVDRLTNEINDLEDSLKAGATWIGDTEIIEDDWTTQNGGQSRPYEESDDLWHDLWERDK